MYKVIVFAATVALFGCSGGGQSDTAQQPPVTVVQAPPDTTGSGANPGSEYAGLTWETVGTPAPTPDTTTTDAQPPGDAGLDDPDAEPYQIVHLLREFDAALNDLPKDQTGDVASDDLLSALAVMDAEYLYGRMVTRAPMTGDSVRETRFWIEQDPVSVTVEVKTGSTDSPCEISDSNNPDHQVIVPKCFWTGHALDFRVPLSQIPGPLDTSKPYWVSGFQTCCSDEARNEPYDEIEGAQEVWRVPGAPGTEPPAGGSD